MSNTYTWTIKKINEDHRGYVNSMYLEMSGSDSENTTEASIAVAFSSEDYKSKSSWSDDDINIYAESHKQVLQDMIDEKLQLVAEGKL